MKHEDERLQLSSRDMAGMLEATCAKGKQFQFTARGTSMSPAICNGDGLIIYPIKNSIGLGDIVAYITPGTHYLVIHRVVGKKGEYFLLKGDNVWHSDGYCGKINIHGYVNKVLIQGKESNIFLKTLRAVFFSNNFYKKFFAIASRFNILTLACKVANRLA